MVGPESTDLKVDKSIESIILAAIDFYFTTLTDCRNSRQLYSRLLMRIDAVNLIVVIIRDHKAVWNEIQNYTQIRFLCW